MKVAQWSPVREICVRVETKITDDEHLGLQKVE